MRNPAIIAALAGTLATNSVNSFAPPIALSAPGALDGRVTWTRAQTPAGAVSTRLLVDGITWAEVAANLPRFHGVAQALLIEGGARTNGIRNPRAEGLTPGAIGSGGVAPTNYTITGATGLTITISAVTLNGIQLLRMSIAGTAGVSGSISIEAEASQIIAAVSGQAWTHGATIRRVINSGATPTVALRMSERDAAGAQLVVSTNTTITVNTSTARYRQTYTTVNGACAFVRPLLSINVTNGQVYDCIIDYGWPQLELGAFPTTPILPVAATPAAATRGAEGGTATLLSLGILPHGASRIETSIKLGMTGTVPNMVPIQIDDGSDNNRVALRNITTSGTSRGLNIVGGVATNLNPGNAASSTQLLENFFDIYGTGSTRLKVFNTPMASDPSDFAEVTAAGAPVFGLTTLRIGNQFDALQPFFGELGYINIIPRTDIPFAVIRPGISRLPMVRAQASSMASMTLGSDGLTWAEVAADTARFYGVAQSLIMESGRTNFIRNPRAEGATPGSPGTLPTNYGVSGIPTGAADSVVAVRSINGLPGLEHRVSGPASGTGNPSVLFESNAANITILANTLYTVSVYITLTAGSFANVTNWRARVQTYLADGTTLVTDHLSSTLTFPTATQARVEFQFTSAATAVRARFSMVAATAIGALDYTIHYGAPQFELSSFGPWATTPMLPVVGTPAQAVRAADQITQLINLIPINTNGASTGLFKLAFYGPVIAGQAQLVASITDNPASPNNRMLVSNQGANGTAIAPRRTLAGVALDGPIAGNYTAGVDVRVGYSCDGNGRLAVCVDGRPPTSVIGALTGFTTFHISGTTSAGSSVCGFYKYADLFNVGVPDDRLRALVAGIP